jgi:DNA-binding MarR family transcriptional regulator
MIVLRLAKLVAMALAEHDLTEHQYRVLSFAAAGDADMTEMCTRLVMKPPNLSTLIDGLVARRLVERRRRHDDRRRVDLLLTSKGKRLVERATREAEDSLAGLAVLGEGTPDARMAGLDLWSTTIDEAARLLHSDRAGG